MNTKEEVRDMLRSRVDDAALVRTELEQIDVDDVEFWAQTIEAVHRFATDWASLNADINWIFARRASREQGVALAGALRQRAGAHAQHADELRSVLKQRSRRGIRSVPEPSPETT